MWSQRLSCQGINMTLQGDELEGEAVLGQDQRSGGGWEESESVQWAHHMRASKQQSIKIWWHPHLGWPKIWLGQWEGMMSLNLVIQYLGKSFQVLLRGAVLRNTPWCYGVVLFAGKDTKLMQNSGKTKFKRTSIDKLLNFIILGIVIFLLSMCLFCTVACGFWESMIGYNFKVNLLIKE